MSVPLLYPSKRKAEPRAEVVRSGLGSGLQWYIRRPYATHQALAAASTAVCILFRFCVYCRDTLLYTT